jgi:hypothetical protein
MLIKKLKTQENEGATSKYPEHTDIKVFGHIPEVFLALKIILFSDQSCFFSATMLQSLTPIYSLYFLKPHLELSEEIGKFRLLFLARSSVKIALLSVKCLYFAKPFSVQSIAWLLIL